MLLNARKAVGLFAHSDDEMICAGTLHRLVRQGCEVHVVTFAPAATEDDRRGGPESIRVVVPEWHHALDLIGVQKKHRQFIGIIPSADFQPHRQQICQIAYDICEREKPDLVLTLSPEDENTAHAIVGVESERVLRGRVPAVVRCNFAWNYGLGRPNLFVRLDEEDLEAKRQVIAAYKSQHFRYSYGEMLINYCIADGLSVKVRPAAEKFELVRSVL